MFAKQIAPQRQPPVGQSDAPAVAQQNRCADKPADGEPDQIAQDRAGAGRQDDRDDADPVRGGRIDRGAEKYRLARKQQTCALDGHHQRDHAVAVLREQVLGEVHRKPCERL